MKLLVNIFMALLLFPLALSAQSQKPGPYIKFDVEICDFGTLNKEKNPVKSYTFIFHNTGTEPLVINKVTAACGCTLSKYTKTPVEPGKKGKVTVEYNGKYQKPGAFAKGLSVYVNGPQKYTRIFIKGVLEEE